MIDIKQKDREKSQTGPTVQKVLVINNLCDCFCNY